MSKSPTTLASAAIMLVLALASGCATPAATAMPTAAPLPSPTATPTTQPTATATHTSTPTQTATSTPTPANKNEPTWALIADRLPKAPKQPFKLAITEEELTQLVAEEAAKNVEVEYDRLAVKIHAAKVVVTTFAKFEAAGTGLDIEAEGLPIVVDQQVRFQTTRLEVEDAYYQLTKDLTQVVVNTLNKSLYFLQPTRKASIKAVNFAASRVQLLEGAMEIEGVTY